MSFAPSNSPTPLPSQIPTFVPTLVPSIDNTLSSQSKMELPAILIIIWFSVFAVLFIWCFTGGPSDKCGNQ